MFKRTCVLVAAVGFLGISSAFGDLAGKVENIISKPTQKKVEYGIQIIKADTGAVVYAHNATAAMTPASNMELVTSTMAVGTLGPQFEYKTVVGLSGNKLIIIGSGDPLFGEPEQAKKYGKAPGWIVDDIIVALKRNSITSIHDIIVDRTIFEPNSINPNWPKDQLDCWYASEVCGLNYYGNCIDVIAKNDKGKLGLSTEPATGYISLVRKGGGKGAGVWCNRGEGSNTITVSGNAPKGPVRMQITVNNPAGMFAYILAESLPKAGITVSGMLYERPVTAADQVKVIAEYKTPIGDVLMRCNKDSYQLAAECLLKSVSASKLAAKRGGNWAHGKKLMGEYLAGLGVKPEEYHFDDGCGLSHENKLSANALTAVLLNMYKSPNWKMFSESLSVGGQDGTMHRYFKESRYRGKILAKTGYINGVKSLSGVCSTDGGDYIFSILTNNATGDTRDAINEIVEATIDLNSKDGGKAIKKVAKK